jgi:FkbM family methyltransferase
MTGPSAHPGASTIVARNYLPAARVLAESFMRHHPGAGFTVLVVDAVEGELEEPASGVRLITPSELDLDPEDFARMAVSYTATELCTAVKPWLLRYLLVSRDVAIYLDPDIEVFAPFADEVADLARDDWVVLTPHVLEPIPRDGFRPSEADIMLSGVFNLGFIGVSRGADGFLRTWETRMRQDAIFSPQEQLFFDQRWIDNVPAMFRHAVIRDPGYNVAYWNVYQRSIERSTDGTVTAGSEPLRFLHYSGYRPEKPWLISIHYADVPRVVLSEHPLLSELFASYRQKLIDAGYPATVDTVPYRWSSLPDGTAVPTALRRAFRDAWVRAEQAGNRAPRSPFGAGGAADFIGWATSPADAAQERVGLSPWALAVWREREDVRHAFPDPLGGDAADFHNWCRTAAVEEGALPPGIMPPSRLGRTVEIRREPGVNLLGYLTTESGVGELGRLVHEVIGNTGLALAASIEESTVINRTGHPGPDDATLGDPEYPVSVVCVNADMTPLTLRLHPEFARNRYVIGVWGWEVSEFPDWMHGAFEHVDEVWTYSDFCVEAIGQHSSVPVHRFPIPVRDPLGGVLKWRPNDGLTRFLFVFDHNSVFERKNPLALVAAFQQAFGNRDDVALIIKSVNGDRHPSDREQLRVALGGDPRIELIEHYLHHDEVAKMFASVDCYVSLHRSEGFGLTVAEAMANGLPVIATDYSATSEFLGPETGWPIPYRLVPVGHHNPPYPAHARWAEPDIDAAVSAMLEVADDPASARRKGELARDHILATRSVGAAAAWVERRIREAHSRWLDRGGPQGEPDGPAARVASARHAVHVPPDVDAPSRVPLARMFRRAVLRALDHHDHHQRSVLDGFVDAVEDSVKVLVERIDHLESDLANTRTKFAVTNAERIDSVDHKLVELISERDVRLGRDEAAIEDLRDAFVRRVPAIQESLLRLHEQLHPAPANTEGVSTDVGVLRLVADDTVMLPWFREYGRWEDDEAQLLDLLLRPGATFVDIGAHVGYFTIRGLHRVGAEGAVFAVEPSPVVRELLEHNVTANVPAATAAKLTILPVVAWDDDVDLRMDLARGGNTGDNRVSSDGGLKTRGIRLDSEPCFAGRRIDVVKCDAQGTDHRALAGMAASFDVNHPHILCEFDPSVIAEGGEDPVGILRTYRSWGYEPIPVTANVVAAVAKMGADAAETGSAPSDAELIAAARDTSGGFLTLWLRPPNAEA